MDSAGRAYVAVKPKEHTAPAEPKLYGVKRGGEREELECNGMWKDICLILVIMATGEYTATLRNVTPDRVTNLYYRIYEIGEFRTCEACYC